MNRQISPGLQNVEVAFTEWSSSERVGRTIFSNFGLLSGGGVPGQTSERLCLWTSVKAIGIAFIIFEHMRQIRISSVVHLGTVGLLSFGAATSVVVVVTSSSVSHVAGGRCRICGPRHRDAQADFFDRDLPPMDDAEDD